MNRIVYYYQVIIYNTKPFLLLAQTALASPLDIFQNMPYNYGVRHCDKFTVFKKGKLNWYFLNVEKYDILLKLKYRITAFYNRHKRILMLNFISKNLEKKEKNCLHEYDQTLD